MPVVAGNDGEVGIKLVVGLGEKIAVGAGEDPDHVWQNSIQRSFFCCIEDDREGEVPQCLTISEDAKAVTKVFDVRCLDSSISTSRGFTIAASLCTDEMKDDLETLKCRLRFVISFRATALSRGTHSVTAQKFA